MGPAKCYSVNSTWTPATVLRMNELPALLPLFTDDEPRTRQIQELETGKVDSWRIKTGQYHHLYIFILLTFF